MSEAPSVRATRCPSSRRRSYASQRTSGILRLQEADRAGRSRAGEGNHSISGGPSGFGLGRRCEGWVMDGEYPERRRGGKRTCERTWDYVTSSRSISRCGERASGAAARRLEGQPARAKRQVGVGDSSRRRCVADWLQMGAWREEGGAWEGRRRHRRSAGRERAERALWEETVAGYIL